MSTEKKVIKEKDYALKDLTVHQVNIAHYRLVELSKLSDQAKPFYDWVEKHAKKVTGSHKSFHEIMMSCSKADIKGILQICYSDKNTEKPFLFDGMGRVYAHVKACFYFFAWIIRDAPQQRLSPLIARMQRADSIAKIVAEIDAIVELIYEYRNIVKSFEWQAIREIIIDRLEGSRRSIRGHSLEANVRTGLVMAIQNYYAIHNNYGLFKSIDIAPKQIKVGRHTVDVSAELTPKTGTLKTHILVPIKTRETEGGGHSHIFTRDIVAAISDIDKEVKNHNIIVIIIAENWSVAEIQNIDERIDLIFHFNMSPNKFSGFDEEAQIKLNRHVEALLDGEKIKKP